VRRWLWAGVVLCGVLCGCVSSGGQRTGGGRLAAAGGFGLPAGGELYVYADVAPLRPLLVVLLARAHLTHGSVRRILEKTARAGVVLFPAGEGESFIVCLRGSGYPALGAALSFALSRDWKREKSGGGQFWRSARAGFGVRISPAEIRLTAPQKAAQNPSPPASAALSPPPRFWAWAGEAAAAGWSPDAALLNKFLKQRRIAIQFPAKFLFFALLPEPAAAGGERRWFLRLSIEAENAARAQSILSLLAIVKNALDEGEPNMRRLPEIAKIILRANTSLDGASVRIETESFSEDVLLTLIEAVRK
jgi:hypothetical protein